MTKLKQTVYKTIEIAEDEDYGMVVGNIVMDGNKMHYAEIVGGTICNHEELANIRAFLDDVEETMETETMHTVSNVGCETEALPDNFWNVVRQKDIIIKQQSNAIEEYKEAIRVERIDHDAERETIVAEFSKELRKKNAIINEITRLRIKEVENRQSLEAELSARKHDCAMLTKVVDIVKNWDDSTGRAFPPMYKILDLLVDYTDVPEDTDDTTARSGRDNVASGNTSCTVEMNIRCE